MKKLLCLMVIAWPAFSQLTSEKTSRPETSPAMTERAAARFLDQATWGPTPASIAQLQQMGITNVAGRAIRVDTSDLPDQPILRPPATRTTIWRRCRPRFSERGDRQGSASPARGLHPEPDLGGFGDIRSHPGLRLSALLAHFPRQRVRQLRDLIKAVTLSPAMGTLSQHGQQQQGNAAKGTSANENYARELMQLFTLGLTQLNPDGSPVLDAEQQSRAHLRLRRWSPTWRRC